jgi:hypothetical protein
LADAVAISEQVDKAKARIESSFNTLSQNTDCNSKEEEIECKEEAAHYVESKEELDEQSAKYEQQLQKCGLTKDCDMDCVRECSFWTWNPWSNCFSTCGCTNFVG